MNKLAERADSSRDEDGKEAAVWLAEEALKTGLTYQEVQAFPTWVEVALAARARYESREAVHGAEHGGE